MGIVLPRAVRRLAAVIAGARAAACATLGGLAALVQPPRFTTVPDRPAERIPLDLTVSFSDLPELADIARRAISGSTVPYRLEGTVGVDAGSLGRPAFGLLTLLTGEMRIRR